jgi:hypothetical protein
MSAKVQGYCPMGCGRTLFLGSGGYVTCSLDKCPNPSAAADILDVREYEHVVLLGEHSYSISHPLRERLDGELFDCGLHAYLANLGGPPRQPGRYRVAMVGGAWYFQGQS